MAHSLWFTLISELGVMGIIIYGLLLYYNVRDIFRLKRLQVMDNDETRYIKTLSSAFIASFAGYFVSASFVSVLYYPHYWYLTGIIVAMVKIVQGSFESIQKQGLASVRA